MSRGSWSNPKEILKNDCPFKDGCMVLMVIIDWEVFLGFLLYDYQWQIQPAQYE
jgi:hypothetical protein